MWVGKLYVVDSRTVTCVIRTTVHAEVLANEHDILRPFEDLVCILRVRSIASIFGQACRQQEEIAVRRSVLVVVPVVEGEDLPLEATTACTICLLLIKTLCLSVPNIHCKVQPLEVLRRTWQSNFGRGHGRKTPDALILVAQSLGLVGGHEGLIIAGLMLEGLRDDGVVLRVSSKVRVFDQCIEDAASLPPIVRVGK